MNKFRCPADGTTVVEAGAFPEHGACRCPKCGSAMAPVQSDGAPPTADVSIVSTDEMAGIVAAAVPIAQELLRKIRNMKGGRFDIEAPMACALALVSCCKNAAGWRPAELLAIAAEFADRD